MRAITNFVGTLNLPDALSQELAGEHILAQHALYVKLPGWLAPLFGPGLRAAQVEQLSLCSYFYFRFLLQVDQALDAPPSGNPVTQAVISPEQAALRLLTYCDLFEWSVRGLCGLFPAGDPFWAQLDACKRQYAACNVREKRRNAVRGGFSLETFEALAADKSAVCNAIVYALSRLGGTTEPVEALLECLRHAHVAMQCLDDTEDFRTDWEQGQYTYAHAEVEAYLEGQGLDPRTMTPGQVHPYFYTSGTADALFRLGQQHLSRAIGLARGLGLEELTGLLAHYVDRFDVYRGSIALNLARARARALAAQATA